MAHPRLEVHVDPGCVTAHLPPPRWGTAARGLLWLLSLSSLFSACALLIVALPTALAGTLFAVLVLCGDLLMLDAADRMVAASEGLRRRARLQLRPGALVINATAVPLSELERATVARTGLRLLPRCLPPVEVRSALSDAEALRLERLLREALDHAGEPGAIPHALRALRVLAQSASPTAA